MTSSALYTIYSDGSACNKRRIGGWGFVILGPDDRLIRAGYSPTTIRDVTSNMMEITAASEGLAACLSLPDPYPVQIFCDSVYVVNGASKYRRAWEGRQWRTADGNDVANRLYWKGLFRGHDALTARAQKPVHWRWVKGHNGNRWNEVVDKLAHYCAHADQKAAIVLANE